MTPAERYARVRADPALYAKVRASQKRWYQRNRELCRVQARHAAARHRETHREAVLAAKREHHYKQTPEQQEARRTRQREAYHTKKAAAQEKQVRLARIQQRLADRPDGPCMCCHCQWDADA
jgi:hypothetical protein